MDLRADLAPPFDRSIAPNSSQPDPAVEGNPGHHLRMRELTAVTTDLPDALVGPTPPPGRLAIRSASILKASTHGDVKLCRE
jgi:hypothetical protein